jgi:hypothetical protein
VLKVFCLIQQFWAGSASGRYDRGDSVPAFGRRPENKKKAILQEDC